ncbi:MAG: TldD/PmbA family protein [Turicibacter sp.]|nr:TldD/PmbA family protein [Turicibacter sp.]
MLEKTKILEAIDYIRELGVDYGDIRVKDINTEEIRAENGQLKGLSSNRSLGAGIRIYANGAMGFAASSDLDDLKTLALLAYNTALASSKLLEDTALLSPKEPAQAEYSTKIEIDPFAVPLADKIALLMECNSIMGSVAGISNYSAMMDFRREHVIFADTDGSCIDQIFYQSGGHLSALAMGKDDTQCRSYGNIWRAGYETIKILDLPKYARIIAEEVVELATAEPCPMGEFDIILMPTAMQLQIHESVGHPTELDRVLGSEAAFAGASFVKPEDMNGLKYGSEHVTIVADGMADKGLGTFAYDDEGVPASRTVIVEKGIFKNFLTSRDNATVVKQNSGGMGLSDGWGNLPIVRMTNINIEPGDFTLDELISGIEYGFLLDANKSWSIDDLRINFQFACEVAREIRDGKLSGKIFKNPTYTGITTDFWGKCDGVCNADFRQMIGVPNCGKGQPMQIMRVAHASQPTRFRKARLVTGG